MNTCLKILCVFTVLVGFGCRTRNVHSSDDMKKMNQRWTSFAVRLQLEGLNGYQPGNYEQASNMAVARNGDIYGLAYAYSENHPQLFKWENSKAIPVSTCEKNIELKCRITRLVQGPQNSIFAFISALAPNAAEPGSPKSVSSVWQIEGVSARELVSQKSIQDLGVDSFNFMIANDGSIFGVSEKAFYKWDGSKLNHFGSRAGGPSATIISEIFVIGSEIFGANESEVLKWDGAQFNKISDSVSQVSMPCVLASDNKLVCRHAEMGLSKWDGAQWTVLLASEGKIDERDSSGLPSKWNEFVAFGESDDAVFMVIRHYERASNLPGGLLSKMMLRKCGKLLDQCASEQLSPVVMDELKTKIISSGKDLFIFGLDYEEFKNNKYLFKLVKGDGNDWAELYVSNLKDTNSNSKPSGSNSDNANVSMPSGILTGELNDPFTKLLGQNIKYDPSIFSLDTFDARIYKGKSATSEVIGGSSYRPEVIEGSAYSSEITSNKSVSRKKSNVGCPDYDQTFYKYMDHFMCPENMDSSQRVQYEESKGRSLNTVKGILASLT